MFFLGVLSIFQMMLLPGALSLLAFKVPIRGAVQFFVYSFGLSFMLNYLVVYFLTVLGFFTVPVVYPLIAIEVIALTYLSWINLGKKISFLNYPSLIKAQWDSQSFLGKGVIFLAVATFLAFVYYVLKGTGGIFLFADEVGGYNRYATEWAQNHLPDPAEMMGYPMAMTANFALTYVILQNSEVHFFNRFVMAFFPLTTVLILLELAWRKKSLVYLLAISLFGIFLRIHMPRFIGTAVMDLPVGCAAFIAFYAMLNAMEMEKKDLRVILLPTIFATWASVVKQAGLFFIPITIVWSLWFCYSQKFGFRFMRRVLFGSILTVLIGAASWYLWIQYCFYMAYAFSEATYLVKSIHLGRGYIERIIWSLKIFFDGGPIYPGNPLSISFCILLIFGCLLSLLKKEAKAVLLIIVVPFTIFWALFFSYEIRTLGLVFPFLCYCSAFGLENFLKLKFVPLKTIQKVEVSKKSLGVGVFVFIMTIILSGFFFFPAEKLIARQRRLQMTILDPELNQKLVSFHQRHGFKGKVVTHYGMFRYLPHISEFYFQASGTVSADYLNGLSEREDVWYILLRTHPKDERPYLTKEASELVVSNLKSGRYKLIFAHDIYELIQIRN